LEEGQISTNYIPTNEQIADVWTKALAHEKHGQFIEEMGVVDSESWLIEWACLLQYA
jgi:hypothetical protein